ncbi:MAG: S8 family serine peptidase [Caldilineaceae bacterium]
MNIDLGGSGRCSTAEQSATINDVVSQGAVVVVAAGNDNQNASNSSPANCNNVISVAATDHSGNRAFYSDYGAVIKISAPGGGSESDPSDAILSTVDTGAEGPQASGYAYYIGTSMATPHVTGVVSLMFSLDAALTPAQVLQLLRANATSFPTGSTCSTTNCGAGIVNAAAVLQAVLNRTGATPTPTATATATPVTTPPPQPTTSATPTFVPTAVGAQAQSLYLPLVRQSK